MPRIDVIWDLDDDPGGNVQHIAEHGISASEVEEIIHNPSGHQTSRSSARPIVFGRTSAGRLLYVVYDEIEDDLVYPVTAFEIEE